MRLSRLTAALLAGTCLLLGCSSDNKSSSANTDSSAVRSDDQSSSSTPATDGTPLSSASGDADCAALKDDLANLIVNWQLVLGLANSPTSAWGQIPLGTLDKFGLQLDELKGALAEDADAVAALSFMSGANDIVTRGVGGDTTAQADLNTYLGTDLTANVSKQVPISIAFDKIRCK